MATSLLDDGVELRRSMFLEFRTAAEDVRQAAADADTSLGRAVHDYRKALRRGRALLRMIAGELPKADRRDVYRALTDARRSLGPARDHAVANDVLGQLQGDEERVLAKTVLDRAAASSMASSEIKQLLSEGAARTAAQVELLDAALPPRLEWRSLLDGVRATYAEARKARRDAKDSRRAFHTWRRRSKELAIQLEILARTTAPQLDELRKQVADANDQLGETVDLLMARDFVRAHAAEIDEDGVDLLESALEHDLDDKIRDGRRAGRDAFRRKSRVFARKLAKAVKRDVTPVAAPPLIRSEEFAMT
ncbi:MAG TPA: CHAD domain-containing protein [Kofleriaceae bacterium]